MNLLRSKSTQCCTILKLKCSKIGNCWMHTERHSEQKTWSNINRISKADPELSGIKTKKTNSNLNEKVSRIWKTLNRNSMINWVKTSTTKIKSKRENKKLLRKRKPRLLEAVSLKRMLKLTRWRETKITKASSEKSLSQRASLKKEKSSQMWLKKAATRASDSPNRWLISHLRASATVSAQR